jgi:hypothetical protein
MSSREPNKQAVQAPEALLRAQHLANLLDNAFTLPIFRVKFGLDFVLGLVPVVGDILSFIIALRIVVYARQLGAPASILAHMLKNLVIDLVLGSVPLLGDIVDNFFRANQRNVRLMEKWWVAQHHATIKAQAKQALENWSNNQS